VPQRLRILALSILCVVFLCGADWRQFRGNFGTGAAPNENVPTSWNNADNMAWSVELEGRGVSSPIVIGHRVVITSVTGFSQDRLCVLCFESDTGKRLWERHLWSTGRTTCQPKTCVAAPTPASDGQRIYAFFSTNDLACFDPDGNLLWCRGLTHDFPNASNSLGMASSPVVVDDTVIVQVETDADSFAMGLDASTGLTRWKRDRPRRANWSSPTVWRPNRQEEPLVVLQASDRVVAVRPGTGQLVWRYDQGASTISSSSPAGDTVLVPSKGLTALTIGNSTKQPQLLWQDNRLRPSTCSPLVYGQRVYVVNGSILKCADVENGSLLWQLRLSGPFSSSPLGINGHLFLFNESGLAFVVKLGEQGKVVAENNVGETILATPAVSDGALYVRSDHHLWKIASKN